MKVHSNKITISEENNGYTLTLELVKYTPSGRAKEIKSVFVFTDLESLLGKVDELLKKYQTIHSEQVIEQFLEEKKPSGDKKEDGQK